jgi:CelD/BcsL family acetyltransferase involved in cellulose biosynthesis
VITPEITIHHSINDTLKDQWQLLWDKSPEANFHNSPQWFLSCKEGLDISNYLIITITNDGQLEAVFPLLWEKRFGIPALCNPGEKFTDKSTLLLREKNPKYVSLLMDKLMTLGNFYLEEFSADVAEMILSSNKSLVKQKASINPYLPLHPDPLRFMTNKMRNKIRNRIKRHEGHMELLTYKGDPKGLEEAFALDARSTKRRQGKSDLAGEREKKFMYTLLKMHGDNFTVDFLMYDSVPVVYTIGLVYKNTYHAFQTAYDGTYSQLSPGKVLNFFLYERLVKEGKEMFDYSRGMTYLKKEFTPLFHMQYDIIYSKFFFVLWWWKTCHFLYNFILESKLLYGTYLFFKKLIFYR